MASLTQQPQLQPQPNLEPPGFALLRDLLMRKLIGQESSPYGATSDSAQSLFNPQGRGMFDPYSGGYGGQGGGQQGSQNPAMGQIMNAMTRTVGPRPMQPPQQGGAPAGPGPMMPQSGGGGGYGFDGYTLNGQISNQGNFDGCIGQDAPQMGDPRRAAAIRAIMAAMHQRGMRPPMRHGGLQRGGPRPMGGGQRPMMGGPMPGPPPMPGAAPIGMDSPYHDQRGPMAPLGMDAYSGGTPQAYTQQMQPYSDVMSMGIPGLMRQYGAGNPNQFQQGQWGLPTAYGQQYTGAQHEIGGNPMIANAFQQGGASPADLAHWLVQGSQAQRAYSTNPQNIQSHLAQGQDVWGNQMPTPTHGITHSANYGNPGITQAGHFGVGGGSPLGQGGPTQANPMTVGPRGGGAGMMPPTPTEGQNNAGATTTVGPRYLP
jgi:hypothetical protein